MRLKQISITVFLCLYLMLTLTACTSSKSLTFRIENGESVKVTLNTTDGYNLLQNDGMITVQKNDTDVLNGIFLTASGYETYVDAITSSSDAVILKATPENAPTLYLYQVDGAAGMETDFLLKIPGGETGLLLGSLSSREEAEAAFHMLTFEIVK